MPLTRWKILIEYKGTRYAGWQRQEDGIATVQGAIERAIHQFCGQFCTLHVAGRTDAGVHAEGQVAHFDLDYGDRPLSAHQIRAAINFFLKNDDITILHAEAAAADFHARFHATRKIYQYRILNRASPPACLRDLRLHVHYDLDIQSMQRGARHLLGHHDFTSFRARECQAKSPFRTLDRADIISQDHGAAGREIIFEFEGKSFLHHQVRNMVGSLLLVGRGKWAADDIKIALAAKDRTQSGPTAPPHGLFLVQIFYGHF